MVVYVIGNSIITKMVVVLCINITFHIQGSLHAVANIFIFLPSTLLYYAVYFQWTNCYLIIRIIHIYSFIYLQYLYVDYFYKWCTLGKIINKSIFLDWFMFLILFFFCSKHWNVDTCIRKIHLLLLLTS